MKPIVQLLSEIREKGILISIDGEDLKIKAPKGAFSKELQHEISERKSDLIDFLNKTSRKKSFQNIKKTKRDVHIPLSFAQQRLWFLDKLEQGQSAAYNIPMSIRVQGNLDILILKETLNEIVKRHEVLRTVFKEPQKEDGKFTEPVQVILPELFIEIPVTDISSINENEREKKAKNIVSKESAKPFDLLNGPLIKAGIIKSGANDHILSINVHHIAFDGWSTGVFLKEFKILYKAFSDGKPSPLSQPDIQYADFAKWQKEQLTGEKLEAHLNFWKEKLENTPSLLELPLDHPRPPVQTFKGDYIRFEIDSKLTNSLKDLTQKTGATLFMTLYSAFAALLSKYSGKEDIVIGSPIANRNHKQIEPLIGFFVNTLVLRADLSENPDFINFMEQVKNTTLEAYEHQDLPFEKLVDELDIERSMSHNPLFHVAFVLQNAPMESFDLPDIKFSLFDFEYNIAKFDLTLYMEETEDKLSCSFEYNTDIFDRSTIQRMIRHFKTLLCNIVENPEQKISELSILSEQERHKILVEFNDTKAEYPKDKCIHHLFEEQVKKTPDSVALVFENKQLTYKELNEQANQVAHYLQTKGVKPETLVGICMERSIEMIVAIFGILKAGGAYVPIDPDYPKERIHFMLEDSDVKILLTHEKLSGRLADITEYKGDICFIDNESKIFDAPKTEPLCKAESENLAYVIYTSGSTGKPKGVMLEHKGLCNLALAQSGIFGIEKESRILQFASISFDASMWEIVMTLPRGAGLYMGSSESLAPGEPLFKYCIKHKITHATLPQSSLGVMPAKEMPDLKVIILAGEAIPPGMVGKWSKGRRLFNAYGPTESTVCASIYECTGSETIPPIGTPIDNIQVYILDKNLQLLPVGIPGELHIGGAGLARGYLNRHTLTKEKFIPNPFSNEPNSRLYKTGDLARWLPDGNIEFLGRIDFQIKIRGFRIEQEEIESLLSKHDQVKEAVVTVRENHIGDKCLVSYIVPDHNTGNNENAVKMERRHVSLWKNLYENNYGNEPAKDYDFDITGWNSSYTGEPIPAEYMREWTDCTVERILALKPRKAFEIGFGTGLLLFRIAPFCEKYNGIDFSQNACEQVSHTIDELGSSMSHVKLFQGEAEHAAKAVSGTFDTVIINSVVQYFPDVNYLMRVIEEAISLVSPEGSVFLGDLRNFSLLELYHTSVETYKAINKDSSASCSEVLRRIQSQVFNENELLVSPCFFIALKSHFPQISHVEVKPKYGKYENELNYFRYEAILHIKSKHTFTKDYKWFDCRKEKFSLADIRETLSKNKPEILGIAYIPNKRLLKDLKILEFLKNSKPKHTIKKIYDASAKNSGFKGIHPKDLLELTNNLPYELEISWARGDSDGSYDVIFKREDYSGKLPIFKEQEVGNNLSTYTNQPLRVEIRRDYTAIIREYLKKKLPDYMLPSFFVFMDSLPLTPNGKIDRKKLPEPSIPISTDIESMPQNETEKLIADIWQEVLDIEKVGIHDNFFDVGGHSLLIVKVHQRLKDIFKHELSHELSIAEMFQYPTIHALAQHIDPKQKKEPFIIQTERRTKKETYKDNAIAVIGMACRVPGAKNIDEFWHNLKYGKESISFFTDEELLEGGTDHKLLKNPDYVKAGGVLSDIEMFDASFFNFTPKEAEAIDPQHRIFMECAWEALENAGCKPETDEYLTGVFAGVEMNTYMLNNLYTNPEHLKQEDAFQVMLGNDKDFLSTSVSYKLNLKGPSVNIQTACSTSLVAVHFACQSLLNKESDIALAGGVSVRVPHKSGYLYQEGMIASPDGHCRAFDAKAKGTVGGSGCGIVVLKRLKDALKDNDSIYAVIKGSAVNNDGSVKVGYTAPGVDGQAAVISMAINEAGIDPETITYIEAHGTGTELGDPVEIAALTQAFARHTQKKNFCAIGSVKTNTGHLGTAAGVTGLIKTILALKNKKIPPSLHFENPNPQIDFANSPFYVNKKLSEWNKDSAPLRAGVSSFGIGGTNAHVILEEAPETKISETSQSYHLISLSAKTESALDKASANLADYLKQNPDINISDVAYTLLVGRSDFSHRRFFVCKDVEDAVKKLVSGKDVFTDFYKHKIEQEPVKQEEINKIYDAKNDFDTESRLISIGKLWLKGENIDPQKIYKNEKLRRIPLPSYPFERQYHWIEPYKQHGKLSEGLSLPEKKPDIADWFYIPSWKRLPLNADKTKHLPDNILLFIDETGAGKHIADMLTRQRKHVTIVKAGKDFRKQDDGVYTINPDSSDDYKTLIAGLKKADKLPETILHMWSLTHESYAEPEHINKGLNLGLYSLMFLVQSLGEQNFTEKLQIVAVTNGVHQVSGEEILHPEKAAILGPVKVIPQEYPNISCCSVDVVIPQTETLSEKELAEQILKELTIESKEPVIALRGKYRWVQIFEPVRLEKSDKWEDRLKQNGVYLITGGLGGIGLALAEHLAKRVKARLILTGRSKFPERDKWTEWLTEHGEQNSVSHKIKKIEEMEKSGAEVLVFSADIANYEEMQGAIVIFEKKFGKIDGVIHAAGITKGKSIDAIENIGKNECEKQFKPKLYGTLVLAEIFREKNPDFCLLCSSLSSVLGGLGFVAYSAANILMDAFAQKYNLKMPDSWISINWDGWNLEDKEDKNEQELFNIGSKLRKMAIKTQEGVEAFKYILSYSDIPQLIVSTGNLQTRIDQWINRKSSVDTNAPKSKGLNLSQSRRNLQNAYIAPGNKTEQAIANIWQECLGIEKIGINDDFFEVDGNSLMAVQIVSEIKRCLQIDLSVHSLLNAPTIAALAALIKPRPIEESLLVQLQKGSEKRPPLFLIHGGGGHVFFYHETAYLFGAEQPVYGIRAKGTEGETELLTDVKEMAEQYIKEIQFVQPEGPYFLGGYSFGGIVAFEIAQQLFDMNQKTALLALIDTYHPSHIPQESFNMDNAEMIYRWLTQEGKISISPENLRKLEPDEQISYFAEQSDLTAYLTPEQIKYSYTMTKLHRSATQNYIPLPYPGKIIFFKAEERDDFILPHYEATWIDLAEEGVEVHEVPGNHQTMSQPPNVNVIAKHLKKYIANLV